MDKLLLSAGGRGGGDVEQISSSNVGWLEVSVFDVSANELFTDIRGGSESGKCGELSPPGVVVGNCIGSERGHGTSSTATVPGEKFIERGGE